MTVIGARTRAAGSDSSPARTRERISRFSSPPTRNTATGWLEMYASVNV
jgi:hypothetical protein